MHRTDAPLVERIFQLTGGAVTAQDMHETRLDWLKANGRWDGHADTLPNGSGDVCLRNPENLTSTEEG